MIRPRALQKGDMVAIVAPAGRLKPNGLDGVSKILNDWGLITVVGKNVWNGHNYFSAADKDRLSDFQEAIDNPEIKAILCARGGYGTTRILNQLDFSGFIKNPKWIAGYSDITALHLKLNQLNIESVHSLMPTGFGDAHEESLSSLRNVLFDSPIKYTVDYNRLNVQGKASGQIIGGNLSLLCDSLGTATELDFGNKVLFIEEVDEPLYKLDRMLVQLRRAGKLAKLSGLIVGHFTSIKDGSVPFGQTVEELILEHASFGYPILFGLPVGHESLNLAIPYSRKCTLTVSEKNCQLEFE